MRLNFSASAPDEIREGIRRIGGVIESQVGLYESITGEHDGGHRRCAGVSRGFGGSLPPSG